MESVESKKKETKPDTLCNCFRSRCLVPYCKCFVAGNYCENRCKCDHHCRNKPDDEATVKRARDEFELPEKTCYCQKNKCLKLYCNCFAAGVNCADRCKCGNCHNKPGNEDTVQKARDQYERPDTLCNCSKSKCLTKLCKCFRAGINCADWCKCDNCYNKPDYEDTVQKARDQYERKDKVCNCNKFKCLTKLCKCFAAGINCTDWCKCDNCHNKPDDEDTVQKARDQFERKDKVCKCRKTKCLEPYCKCFTAKIHCNDGCACDNCHNKPDNEDTQEARKKMKQPEKVTDINQLITLAHPCLTEVPSLTSHDVSLAESEKGTNFHSYSSALIPKQPCPSEWNVHTQNK